MTGDPDKTLLIFKATTLVPQWWKDFTKGITGAGEFSTTVFMHDVLPVHLEQHDCKFKVDQDWLEDEHRFINSDRYLVFETAAAKTAFVLKFL